VGLVVITAGAVRARNLDVVSDPVAADPISGTPGNIAHVRIVGPNDRSTRRYLVSQSVILVYPLNAQP
jgi:hypothetical protein